MWDYVGYGLMIMWSVGCIGGCLLIAVGGFSDGDLGLGFAVTLLGLPIAVLLGLLPWAIAEDMASPDLVTLKKADWVCSTSHNVTSMTPVSTGKTTIMVPTTQSVCDTYSRIG